MAVAAALLNKAVAQILDVASEEPRKPTVLWSAQYEQVDVGSNAQLTEYKDGVLCFPGPSSHLVFDDITPVSYTHLTLPTKRIV